MKPFIVLRPFVVVCLSCFFLCPTFGQSISQEKKNIIGTWIAEEGTWTFVFDATQKCNEYTNGKLEAQYVYKITRANSPCGKQAKVDLADTTISFLQLDNIKTKEQVCYLIEGISAKTLSMTGYMLPEPSVFKRKSVPKK